jgi:crossover junction endodeoxyribonuclease RuvC
MRVLGLDPGLAACGYGVVEGDGAKVQAVAFGCWHTEAGARIELRLRALFVSVATLLERQRPVVVALEESFVGRDARGALGRAGARRAPGRLRAGGRPVCRVSAGEREAGRVRLWAG